MFFMGGMTLGYLHPPVRAKRIEAGASVADEETAVTLRQQLAPTVVDGAIERTLLWARRILC